MVAKPGTKDYGALSEAVQYYTEPDIVILMYRLNLSYRLQL